MPFFSNETVKLHYHKYGSGQEIMLAFHGFGMRGTQFAVLEPALRNNYTVYSIDLFFHGDTCLQETTLTTIREGLSSKVFAKIMLRFLEFLGAARFSILSYSMGSLLAFSLVENIPERIDTAFFIAPDGLVPNKLLRFGSRNRIINRLFYKMVYSPKTVGFILNRLLTFGYIDAPLYRILKQEFDSEISRLTCYNAITYHARLTFKQDDLARLMNFHKIKSYFYFGETDKLFPPSIGRNFSKKLTDTTLHIFKTGHELVNAELNELISRQLAV